MPRLDLIQFRRGDSATWSSVNPVLEVSELGYETDTGFVKFGDGSSTWSALDYFAPGSVVDPDTTLLGNPITPTELSYLSGVTSNVQTQLNNATSSISEKLSILHTLPASDHSAIGPQTSAINAGASITTMDCVQLASSGKWVRADADDVATSAGFIAISLESKNDNQAMLVALPRCFVRDDSWSWTPGSVLYLSTTVAQLTITQPSGTDDVIRVAGYAVSSDVIWFDPSPDYITHI